MPRRARIVLPGVPHHVTQRGNRKGLIFSEPEDRRLYLELLRLHSNRHELRIWAYALMSNHVHLIVMPHAPLSLSATVRDVHSAYATYFNRKYGLVGHLWHSRFYSAALDEFHLRAAVRYVERNPVRAGMVSKPAEYPWSSAGPHVLGQQDRYLDPGLPFWHEIPDWGRWLEGEDAPESIKRLREATSAGLPCGSKAFVESVETTLSRAVRRQRRGRPPKSGAREM